MKALVFDIKHFSVHDGPGIRTTIFFKGCPLRCVWCQNPEGLEVSQKVLHQKSLCEHYHECLRTAPDNIKLINNEIEIVNQNFDNWDKVVNNCPTNAIRYDSKYYSVDELMEIISKDIPFYRKNGGITISGGEPLQQYEFLIQLLKRCKEKNINTCIETSGFIDEERFIQLLKYLDNIYMDFKIFDPQQHLSYTGVYNKQIKKNLNILLNSSLREKAVIRTPLIPTITDTNENIKNIASYLYSIYPETNFELLNFNPLSFPKYQLTGKNYFFKINPKRYTDKEMEKFRNYANKYLDNIVTN
jgi:pyruvate formate lyase activating enzyme